MTHSEILETETVRNLDFNAKWSTMLIKDTCAVEIILFSRMKVTRNASYPL